MDEEGSAKSLWHHSMVYKMYTIAKSILLYFTIVPHPCVQDCGGSLLVMQASGFLTFFDFEVFVNFRRRKQLLTRAPVPGPCVVEKNWHCNAVSSRIISGFTGSCDCMGWKELQSFHPLLTEHHRRTEMFILVGSVLTENVWCPVGQIAPFLLFPVYCLRIDNFFSARGHYISFKNSWEVSRHAKAKRITALSRIKRKSTESWQGVGVPCSWLGWMSPGLKLRRFIYLGKVRIEKFPVVLKHLKVQISQIFFSIGSLFQRVYQFSWKFALAKPQCMNWYGEMRRESGLTGPQGCGPIETILFSLHIVKLTMWHQTWIKHLVGRTLLRSVTEGDPGCRSYFPVLVLPAGHVDDVCVHFSLLW